MANTKIRSVSFFRSILSDHIHPLWTNLHDPVPVNLPASSPADECQPRLAGGIMATRPQFAWQKETKAKRVTDHHWVPRPATWLQEKSVVKKLFWAILGYWALQKVVNCFVFYLVKQKRVLGAVASACVIVHNTVWKTWFLYVFVLHRYRVSALNSTNHSQTGNNIFLTAECR